MAIYEFFDEEYNNLVDKAKEIQEVAEELVDCLLSKSDYRSNSRDSEVSLRNNPAMRNRRVTSSSYNNPRMRRSRLERMDVSPHMRGGYIVRPEEDDMYFNERYNWER